MFAWHAHANKCDFCLQFYNYPTVIFCCCYDKAERYMRWKTFFHTVPHIHRYTYTHFICYLRASNRFFMASKRKWEKLYMLLFYDSNTHSEHIRYQHHESIFKFSSFSFYICTYVYAMYVWIMCGWWVKITQGRARTAPSGCWWQHFRSHSRLPDTFRILRTQRQL